jgi:hypothetical protein
MKLGRSLSFVLACALLAGAAQAQATWIVDDDGGPGVQFTDIQPAIDAASAGDVIRVFPGNYNGFTLDKQLVVVGQPGAPVFVNGYPWIRNIVAPGKVVVSHLAALNWQLTNCAGAVLLDDCEGGVLGTSSAQDGLTATGCSDLRIQRSSYSGKDHWSSSMTPGGVGIRLSKSRLQVNHAWVRGGQGAVGNYGHCDGYPGGAGIEAWDSNIHVYSSSIYGGQGGEDFPSPGCGWGGTGGDGGHAVRAAPASVLAAGPTSLVLKGGPGGYGAAAGGKPGNGIVCFGDVRLPPPNANIGTVVALGGGTVQIPDPPDPTLSFKTPQPIAGEPLRFMVHGPQDAIVTLLVGREPVLVAPTALKERRLVSLDQDRAPVGVIDGSGVLIVKIHLPSMAPHGFTFLAQAELVYPDGETRYTNSLTVVLP